MKLYHNPLSPSCHKVMVTLYEKSIPFEGQVVNLMDPATKAAYKKDINPIGKVPFLVLDNGWRIPESSIIVEYLDTHFDSGPRLIPTDMDLARRVRFVDRIADLYVRHNFEMMFLDPMKPADKQSPNAVVAAREQVETILGTLEKDQGSKQYMVGDQFSFADISAATALAVGALSGFSMDRYPHLAKYLAGIQQRPSFQRVHKDAEAAMKAMKGH